jgi:hypothetical protein
MDMVEADNDAVVRARIRERGNASIGIDFDSPIVVESLAAGVERRWTKSQHLAFGLFEVLEVHPDKGFIAWVCPAPPRTIGSRTRGRQDQRARKPVLDDRDALRTFRADEEPAEAADTCRLRLLTKGFREIAR